MIYLVNADSLNMWPLPEIGDESLVRKLTALSRESAAEFLLRPIETAWQNAIGHAETAAVVGQDLIGEPLPANRINVRVSALNDYLLIAQYIGPRLEVGATRLPDGAEIRYFLESVD